MLWMASQAYKVEKVAQLRESQRRSIAFLLVNGDENINGAKVFQSLDPRRRRELLTRFDLWIDGGRRDNYFHGWPNDRRYKDCFTFKWKNRSQDQRFYGFLCNPCQKTNASFQVCVIVSCAPKSQFHTETGHLTRAGALRSNAEVLEAVSSEFCSPQKGGPAWLH